MTDYNKVFIDTAPFIYYIEGNIENPLYFDKAKSFFRETYNNGTKLITSAITVEEYMVYPYRSHNQELISIFERLIDSLGIEVVNINVDIAKRAAQIRAEYKNFKAMDSLQLAVANICGCDIMLTNDKQLRQFTDTKCITMDEL